MVDPGEGGDEGVVYLGRNGFKMKAGARTTPPAGTPLTRVGKAAPESEKTPLPAVKTPPPAVKTPPPALKVAPVRPSNPTFRRMTPTPMPPLAQLAPQAAPPSGKGKVMIVGICMIAFSCGVMSTVAVDRFWPRARAQQQCGGGQTVVAAAAAPMPAPEAMALPPAAASPAPAEVTPLPPADPVATDKPAPEAKAPSVAAAPKPPTARPAPVARPAASVSKSPARATGRGAVVARTPPAQGRAVRKRAGATTSSSGGSDTMPLTEAWVDPFN